MTPRLSKAARSTDTLVTDGIHEALTRARAAAGERNVRITGGASLGQLYLAVGLVDEPVLHVVPVLLNGGTVMFGAAEGAHTELELAEASASVGATHLRYCVVRRPPPW